MTKALSASLIALTIASYLALPGLADESTTTDAAGATTADAAAATTTDAAKTESTDNADAKGAQKTSWRQKFHKASNNKITLDSLEAAQSGASTDKVQIADNTDPNKPKDPKDPAAKPAKAKGGGGNVSLPERAAAFTTGVLFGTPIAVLRRTHMEIMQGEHDLIGDYDTWWKKAIFVFPGLFLAVPFGGVSGCGSGAMYSVRNAWKGSGDEPFGKDSFSLGDIGN